MRRLILLRHAKSDWPAGVADLDRPLGKRGRAAAPLMAAYMAREELLPDVVLVSPATRTQQTWDLVRLEWPGAPVYETHGGLYDASSKQLLDIVRDQPAATEALMLIGHNPGLEDLAKVLLAITRDIPPKFPTAALAVIDLPVDDWADAAPHSGVLERFVTPKSLGGEED